MAVVQTRYGSPDLLEVRDVPVPVAGDNEVLVRVRAASLHPDVWHVVTGRPYVLRLMGAGLMRPVNPIPGTDMAGVVERAGRSVTRFRPGDAVFGETIPALQWVNGGAFAEYVAVREDLLAPKPHRVTFAQAASVPTSGYIVLLNLRGMDHWPTGRRVLINGAGGGVGTLALQLLKAHGAHVTTVDSEAKQPMLRSLGADEAIDYRREDCTRRGPRYDLIVDVPANRPFSAWRRALTAEGRYIPIGHEGFGASGHRVLGLLPRFLALMVRSRFTTHLRGSGDPMPTKGEAIAVLGRLLERGTITPVIDSVYQLSDVGQAFRHMMRDELLGKVILTPGERGSTVAESAQARA